MHFSTLIYTEKDTALKKFKKGQFKMVKMTYKVQVHYFFILSTEKQYIHQHYVFICLFGIWDKLGTRKKVENDVPGPIAPKINEKNGSRQPTKLKHPHFCFS